MRHFDIRVEVDDDGDIQLIQEDEDGEACIVISPEQVDALIAWLSKVKSPSKGVS